MNWYRKKEQLALYLCKKMGLITLSINNLAQLIDKS